MTEEQQQKAINLLKAVIFTSLIDNEFDEEIFNFLIDIKAIDPNDPEVNVSKKMYWNP